MKHNINAKTERETKCLCTEKNVMSAHRRNHNIHAKTERETKFLCTEENLISVHRIDTKREIRKNYLCKQNETLFSIKKRKKEYTYSGEKTMHLCQFLYTV